VDDHPINREVAISHLTSAGYLVDEAQNGEEAVRAFELKPYNLIFMDIQMPVMDGHEATKAIREIENRKAERIRTPIIALTAHAIKGYKDKCIQMGMDDFMTKPLMKSDLYAIMEKWTGLSQRPDTNQTFLPENGLLEQTYPTSNGPVDMQKVRDIWEDEDLIQDSFSDFLTQMPSLLASVGTAAVNGDADTLASAAHKCKGALLYAGAQKASEIASSLEQLAQRKEMDQAGELFFRLDEACQDIFRFMKNYLDSGEQTFS
jgi:CheY-like chemotaxis protein